MSVIRSEAENERWWSDLLPGGRTRLLEWLRDTGGEAPAGLQTFFDKMVIYDRRGYKLSPKQIAAVRNCAAARGEPGA
jgi:hypothetical protein